ncbi:hypothetical protein SO3561_09792 [Streptomyces olivochromogenes]|uniref:Uncharacterized protein n=1 Tax=Streptomyces olivochromogenes TaxID=1963 RepID=A0A250VVR1_STROL|nr:hypothetical protein SO3561_09792 [Streptomyces olivochromogenes]
MTPRGRTGQTLTWHFLRLLPVFPVAPRLWVCLIGHWGFRAAWATQAAVGCAAGSSGAGLSRCSG